MSELVEFIISAVTSNNQEMIGVHLLEDMVCCFVAKLLWKTHLCVSSGQLPTFLVESRNGLSLRTDEEIYDARVALEMDCIQMSINLRQLTILRHQVDVTGSGPR